MVDSAKRDLIITRGRRLLVLKACIVAFVAAYLYATIEAGVGAIYSPLLIAISSIGLVMVSAPALAKGHKPWAFVTALGWGLAGWLISWIIALSFNLLASPAVFLAVQSIAVKAIIILLYLKTYLDFTFFREATKSAH